MTLSPMRMIVVAVCLASGAGPDIAAAQDPAGDAKAIEGLWSGAWGGGERGGVVFQPVRAELLIKGDHIELSGFRNANRLVGTVRFDPRAKRLQITPSAEAGGRLAPKAIEYAYELKADALTLTDSDKIPVTLQKHRVAENPLANAAIEFVAATGINEAGDLLVTEFTVLRASRAGATYFQPQNRTLKTRQANVFMVQETGLKAVTLDEARRLIRDPTPVAVSYRQDDRPAPHQFHELWEDMGSAPPDSEAVRQTLSRMLRPGTLVFILSARENVPLP